MGDERAINVSSWLKNGSSGAPLLDEDRIESEWLAAASHAEVKQISQRLLNESDNGVTSIKNVTFNEQSFPAVTHGSPSRFRNYGIYNRYSDHDATPYYGEIDYTDPESRPMSVSMARRRSSTTQLPSDVPISPGAMQFDVQQIDKQRGGVAVFPRYFDNYGQSNSSSYFGFHSSGSKLVPGNGRGGAQVFTRLGAEPYRDPRSDSQIIFEWRLLANVQNRVNTLMFVFILCIILVLYYLYHAPPP